MATHKVLLAATLKEGLYQLDLSKLAKHFKLKFQALVSALNGYFFNVCKPVLFDSCSTSESCCRKSSVSKSCTLRSCSSNISHEIFKALLVTQVQKPLALLM